MRFVGFLLTITLTVSLIEVAGAEMQDVGSASDLLADIELNKIIVSNRRTQVDLSDVTENVTVLSEEEIKELPARNLSEVLSYITGVDIEPRQGFGRATSISIQGSDSRHVRVMIDGIPLNSQSSGQVNPAIFPIENIARIEVIKGAASSLWGSSLGGVINVITKDTAETLIPKGSFTASFAEFRTKKESFDLSGRTGDVGYYLFSSYMESGGEGPKDDVLEKKAFTKLSYDLKEMGKIIASFGYSYADVNSGEYPDGTWQAQPYRNRYGKLGWEGNFDDMDIKVDLKHSRQDIITKSYLSVDDQEPFWRVQTQDLLYQLSLNSSTHLREKDLLVLGGDFDWDTLKSNLYLTKAKSLKLQAPYANYTLKLEPWDFNFGLRYDRNSEFGEQVSPTLGFVYKLGNIPESRVRLTASRAFNAPPLLWKYNEDILLGVAPNPQIEPERAWVYNIGFETKPIDRLWINLSLYRSDVSDAIARAENELGQSYMKNFEKFRRQGVELQFKVNLFAGLDFFATGVFNDVEDRTTGETVRGGGRPRQSFDLGIEYKNKSGFDLLLRGYYDRWNEEATVYFDQLGQEVSVDPNDRKMLIDLKISQELKNFIFFLNIRNLTNSKYWSDYYFPLPERYFEVGMSINW